MNRTGPSIHLLSKIFLSIPRSLLLTGLVVLAYFIFKIFVAYNHIDFTTVLKCLNLSPIYTPVSLYSERSLSAGKIGLTSGSSLDSFLFQFILMYYLIHIHEFLDQPNFPTISNPLFWPSVIFVMYFDLSKHICKLPL